jgi:hypothetical protein
MIAGIDYRVIATNLVEVVITFHDGKTASMRLTGRDVERLSFFIDCLSMELEGGSENEYR